MLIALYCSHWVSISISFLLNIFNPKLMCGLDSRLTYKHGSYVSLAIQLVQRVR